VCIERCPHGSGGSGLYACLPHDTNTYGKSSGRNGNYSTNYQIAGRELLTPDEVRMLDNRYALLFVRGERPVMDEKFDILRHPNVSGTADGKAEPFKHGTAPPSSASLVFDGEIDPAKLPDMPAPAGDFELLSEEDLEERFNPKEEEKTHEKKK
jgi:type IV secretion system protein VirD4